ncbi:hypothetical protein [Melittangium boletus]|uniref:hypothetical protein n=1 Tax=Melittangium boletus TaxID=83453 RepID=UPI003DA21409
MDKASVFSHGSDEGRAHRRWRQRVWGLVALVAMQGGCILWRPAPQRQVVWPDERTASLVGSPMEAGAVIAAAAAVREMVARNDSERLFHGCSSPQKGLDVAVFKQAESDLYFVVLHQRFDRCGGPRSRVLDGWYEYAVTETGEVVAEAPPEAVEDAASVAPDSVPAAAEPRPEAPSPPPPVDAPPPPTP